MVRNRVKKTVILAAFLVAVAEIAARWIFPVPEILNLNRVLYSSIWPAPAAEQKYLSNVSITYSSDPDGFSFAHTLNLYGFRDRTWSVARNPATRRVMFVGDSFVEGFGAQDHETIPWGFEERATERRMSLESLNLGVAAASVSEYCEIVRDALPQFKPDDLIVVFYANDFPLPKVDPSCLAEPLVPVFSNPWLPRLYVVAQRIRDGEDIVRRWPTGPFPFFAAVPHPSNPWSEREFHIRWTKMVYPMIAEAMKKGRFNPRIINQHGRYRRRLVQDFPVSTHLAELGRFAAKHGATLYVTYLPFKAQVSDAYLPYMSEYSRAAKPVSLRGEQFQRHARILTKMCAKSEIPFLDLSPFIAGEESSGARLYWNYDGHMNARGYQRVAEAVFDWWVAQQAGS